MKREVTLFLTIVILVTILWVSRRTSSNKTRKVAATELEEQNQNPGCDTKDLNNYTAIHVGKVYHHPSIVHYAKLGSSVMQLNFREYTSVLSVHKFIKPERIIFHTYAHGLSGQYWDKINSWKDVQVEVNKLPRFSRIGGKEVKWVQHEADYVKLTMIYIYGGIGLDFDVIVINGTRLKYEQQLSECVLAGEIRYINGGFYSCIVNSSFIAKWLESYDKDYRPGNWLHNVSYRPLHLLTDKDSDVCYNVHVDNTICVGPGWDRRRAWLKHHGVKWRTKTAAHYFVKYGIPNDGEGLLKKSFSLAKLIKYVHNA